MPYLERNKLKYNAKVTEGICKDCGTVFFSNRKDAKYCSALCRLHACLKRKEGKPKKSKSESKFIFKSANQAQIKNYLREKFDYKSLITTEYREPQVITTNDKKFRVIRNSYKSYSLEEI